MKRHMAGELYLLNPIIYQTKCFILLIQSGDLYSYTKMFQSFLVILQIMKLNVKEVMWPTSI